MPSNAERARIIREATLKSVTQRDRLSDQSVEELIKIYDDSGDVIAEQIQRVAGNSDQVKLGDLQDLLNQVRQELDALDKQRNKALYRHIDTSAGLGGAPFAGILPPSQLFAINHSAIRFVHTMAGADGLQLSDRLWRLRRGDHDIILGHIEQAIINGEDASHAMMRSMGKGEGVPAHVAQAYQAGKMGALKRSVRELMTGAPDPATGRGVVYQAERVFRTEINRAHGEAYMANAFAHPDVAGVKFCLSPNHRIRDICDTLASADSYGLGAGVYPNRAACPWPAHPNTRSFVEVVFRDEVPGAATAIKPNSARPDMISGMEQQNPFRSAWGDFPDVVIHAPELSVKKHPDYAVAKSGDADAAFKLVKETLSDQAVSSIQAQLAGRRPILTSAHAFERTGVNAIPEALADVLGAKLGLPVDASIVQTNVVGHTGASGFARLARPAAFDGEVKSGAEYYLVDDFIGQGGTLANLKGHIEKNGGKVVGATALTGKPYSATLKPTQEQLEALRGKHGQELEHWWVDRFGYPFDRLTQSEARYLERTADAVTIRDKIAQAEQE